MAEGNKIKIFLASSEELKDDRKEFEIFINRENKKYHEKGIFIELIIREDFLDAMSKTRLQDEYNKVIKDCDIFVMLFFTKVGKYTEEEFETAFGHFRENGRPLIYTYFKDAEISSGQVNRRDMNSLWDFQDKLKELGHFQTKYKNIEDLKYQFTTQLDKILIKHAKEPDGPSKSIPTPNSYEVLHKYKKFSLNEHRYLPMKGFVTNFRASIEITSQYT